MIAETKLLCWADMMPPTQHLMSLSYVHVHWRNTCTYTSMYTCTVQLYVHMYCTYVGMYTCTYVGMYTCTYIRMYARTLIHTYVHVHKYVCTYVHKYVRMYVRTYVHTCMSQVRSIVHWCLYCMGCVCTCNSLLFLSSWRVIRLCQL